MTRAPEPMGGYFGLEPLSASDEWYPTAHKFQSARAAYLALLRAGKPERVWMPSFMCNSMMEPLRMLGVVTERYAVTDTLAVPDALSIGTGDWILYTNYFGLCGEHVRNVLQRFAPGQVVIDNAQAFYAAPLDCLATIYSPRKFFGVPDGGYLFSELPVAMPGAVDGQSIARCLHLLLRAASGPEAGYPSFQDAERSLALQEPRRMSMLTQSMLGAIDYRGARQRRRENFAYLHAALGGRNALRLQLHEDAAPLCYPYRTSRTDLRAKLIRERIYVPTYWPEVVQDAPAAQRALAGEILPLPCDQRYTRRHMDAMLEVIEERRERQ